MNSHRYYNGTLHNVRGSKGRPPAHLAEYQEDRNNFLGRSYGRDMGDKVGGGQNTHPEVLDPGSMIIKVYLVHLCPCQCLLYALAWELPDIHIYLFFFV